MIGRLLRLGVLGLLLVSGACGDAAHPAAGNGADASEDEKPIEEAGGAADVDAAADGAPEVASTEDGPSADAAEDARVDDAAEEAVG
jgi:hypothetical protein